MMDGEQNAAAQATYFERGLFIENIRIECDICTFTAVVLLESPRVGWFGDNKGLHLCLFHTMADHRPLDMTPEEDDTCDVMIDTWRKGVSPAE
jgi:hypothetical protein